MTISVCALLGLVLCIALAGMVGTGAYLKRRFRRWRELQRGAVAVSVTLIAANTYCALSHSAHGAGLRTWCVVVASVTFLCVLGGVLIRLRIATTPTPHPRRILAIGAHPDDLELGCGGTIAKLIDSGHEVHALVLTNGERGGDSSRRPQEALRGGRFLGTTDLEVLGFDDACLADHQLELAQAIEERIRRINPDIIFTHSSNDQHQDHQSVHQATLRAARQHPAILCYESPSVTPDFRPSVFVDIDDYVDVKVAAVASHRDQIRKPYMAAERVSGLAVYRGSQAKVRHAEGYEPIRLVTAMAL
jgi:LmbE family N-acetylglucosaminyl deacetylase